MPPITWRNVETEGGHADAARILEGANRNITAGLDRLGAIVQGQQDVRDANFQNTRTNNTTAYLDKLSSFGTAAELEAARADGSLDAFREQLGKNIDPEAIRGAATARLDSLYQQEEAAYQRERTNLERTHAPLVESLQATILQDPNKGRQEIQQNKDVLDQLGLTADLLGEADAREREFLSRKYEDYFNEDKYTTAKATKVAQQILTDAIRVGGDSSSQAYALARDWMDQAKIPAAVMTQMLGELEAQWGTEYGLTASQLEEMRFFENEQTAALAGAEADAQQQLEYVRQRNALDPQSSYADLGKASFSNAVDVLVGEKNWDKRNTSERLSKYAQQVLDEGNYVDINGKELTAESPAMHAVLTEAAKRAGEAWDLIEWGIVGGKENLSYQDIAPFIKQELTNYANYQERQLKLAEAEKQYNDTVSAARSQVSKNLRDRRDSYKIDRRRFFEN